MMIGEASGIGWAASPVALGVPILVRYIMYSFLPAKVVDDSVVVGADWTARTVMNDLPATDVRVCLLGAGEETSTVLDGNVEPVKVAGTLADVMVPGSGTCLKCHVTATEDGAAMEPTFEDDGPLATVSIGSRASDVSCLQSICGFGAIGFGVVGCRV